MEDTPDSILLSLQDLVPADPLHNPTNVAINDNRKHVTNNTGNGNVNQSQLSTLAITDSTDNRAENTREAYNLVVNQNIIAPTESTDDELHDFSSDI